MAGSVNKVILLGNLGKDPEVRHLESGVAVARFPIATSESFKDKTTGEKKSQTEWHNITVWRGLAEVAEKYLKKGNQVYIEGKLKTRSWQDAEGITKYSTDIVADNMVMLGKAGGDDYSNQPGVNEASQVYGQSNNKNSNVEKFESKADDDLPF